MLYIIRYLQKFSNDNGVLNRQGLISITQDFYLKMEQ